MEKKIGRGTLKTVRPHLNGGRGVQSQHREKQTGKSPGKKCGTTKISNNISTVPKGFGSGEIGRGVYRNPPKWC